MEFQDAVMKRRALPPVRGGRRRAGATIEAIARLAQRTPSAGFSQGQRLVVVVDPNLRRADGPRPGRARRSLG